MRLMRDKKIWHLPVLDTGKFVGVISIGDLVNWIISAQNALDQMEAYYCQEMKISRIARASQSEAK